jgi:RNA-splicing ligase RtcB
MKNLKVFTDDIEQEAINQINELLDQDAFKDSKIRIMPDVHAGKGCVIGFTGNLGNKVIPNIVGVDIGCGMLCVELGNIDLDLEKLDKIIREYVPSGFEVHDERKYKFLELQDLKCYRELKDTKRLERSIGTLGGGNHFIEVDIDENNNKYLVIHTGSRNLGKQVAEYYQELANQLCNYNIDEYKEKQQELIKKYKEQGRKQEIQSALMKLKEEYKIDHKKIPKDLAYLEGQYREDYLHDMKICQEFAILNRKTIANIILKNIMYYQDGEEPLNCWDLKDDYFETIHNYISFEDNIVRKGAISAKKGEMVLIPMNMRDGCIIGVGKGNDDWNQSAPHGAGRIMSRMKAKETFNLDEYKESMKDIYTTSVNENTIDEAPFVYKPMQEIIDNISDTVDIIKIIKPIYNFKASD